MINYDTIISSYDDKLTLMQWLKKVEAALAGAALASVNVAQSGDIVTFSFDFADGTKIETPSIRVNQQITGAQIVNGELVLELSNGESINAGALFNGEIPQLSVSSLTTEGDEITAQKPIVEVMTGYNFTALKNDHEWAARYASAAKNGNKLSIVIFGSIVISTADTGNADFASFTIPADVLSKLVPYTIGGISVLENKNIPVQAAAYDITNLPMLIVKTGTGIVFRFGRLQNLAQYGAGTYYFRVEQTFLLSDNLAA